MFKKKAVKRNPCEDLAKANFLFYIPIATAFLNFPLDATGRKKALVDVFNVDS